jgi:hypothetical protein
MTTKQLSFKSPLSLAVLQGDTTPNPTELGVIIWSTLENALLVWKGVSWEFADTTTSGSGSYTVTGVQVNLGSTPRRAGKFIINGMGFVTNKPVTLCKAVGPYTGKGTLADEAEMDLITATGVVTSATQITVYWQASSPVRGFVKFNYTIGA